MTATVDAQSPAALAPLTQRRVLFFWLPLAASWLLMGSEMPIVNAALARLPESQRMLAAFGIVGSLSLTIESPVIMLLATSTALAQSRQSYEMLRRFTQHLMGLTTLLHVLVAWTPLFDVIVRGWMHVPETIVEPVRLGMRLMVFWSAAIAWRRFKQGVMIRFGETRYVGQGTAVRLLGSAGVAIGLALTGRVPGIAVGALGLAVGVVVEATYAHLAARRTVARQFGPAAPPATDRRLSYGELVRFHTPLAASTLLYLMTQPIISAALSRLPNPELALAAWPVASGLLFITRAPILALPEVIIALIDTPGSRAALRQFTLRLGLVCLAVLAALAFTPLGRVYFGTLIGVNDTLAGLAGAGLRVAVLLPLVMAWQSWFRGALTAQRATPAITLAMVANVAMMATVLAAGVRLQAPGIVLAAAALLASTSAETLTLWAATHLQASRRPAVAAAD
jgi:hypothetical protein